MGRVVFLKVARQDGLAVGAIDTKVANGACA